MNYARRLRWLILLAGFCAACGGGPDEPVPTESAVFPHNVGAEADAVWAYYTGGYTGPRPSFSMFQPDIHCSPQPQGGGLNAYRIPSYQGTCLWDSGDQVQSVQTPGGPWANFNFWATYEIYQNHTPNLQQPFYATLAMNFLCMAAYERAGFSYSAAFPYCSGSGTGLDTVATVRRWVFNTFYPGDLFWR